MKQMTIFLLALISTLALAAEDSASSQEVTNPCEGAYVNQLKSLRNSQLNLKHAGTKETLFDIKSKHDSDIARLILLQGLIQIRSEYEHELEIEKTAMQSGMSRDVDEIKRMAVQSTERMQSFERMLVLEKGIDFLAGDKGSYKDESEFIARIVSRCEVGPYPATAEGDVTAQFCRLLADPKMKKVLLKKTQTPTPEASGKQAEMRNMLSGFYRAYIVSGSTPESLETYKNYLQVAASELTLTNQLKANQNFVMALDSFQKPQDAKILQEAYNSYKKSLEEQFPNQKRLLSLEPQHNAGMSAKIDALNEKLGAFESFTTGLLNDKDMIVDRKTRSSYTDITGKLETYAKKFKPNEADLSELLKGLKCDPGLFKERTTSPSDAQVVALRTCIRGTSKQALEKLVSKLNSSIEDSRHKIQSFSQKGSWWDGSSSKNTYRLYEDLSYAIQFVANKMQKECAGITAAENPYELSSCGLTGINPPESLKMLSVTINQVQVAVETTTVSSNPDIKKLNVNDVCARMRTNGIQIPAAMCYGGFEGKVDIVTVGEEAAQAKKKQVETAPATTTKATAAPSSSDERSDSSSPATTTKKSSSSSSEGYTRSRGKTSSPSNLQIFFNALSSNQNVMSTAMGWASLNTFRGQVLYQSELAKTQIVSEKYQQAWLDYYTQAQKDSWLNFMSSQQSTPLYNGGLYYNFGSY